MTLLSKKDLEFWRKRMPQKEFQKLQSRRTGKITRIALEMILEALKNPGKPITAIDHYGTREADRVLLRRMKEMTEQLELEHLEFSTKENTITFTWKNPFSAVE